MDEITEEDLDNYYLVTEKRSVEEIVEKAFLIFQYLRDEQRQIWKGLCQDNSSVPDFAQEVGVSWQAFQQIVSSCPEVPAEIESILVTYNIMEPKGVDAPQSNTVLCGNACSMLYEVCEAVSKLQYAKYFTNFESALKDIYSSASDIVIFNT
jgi:hypothetical protein